MELTPKGCIMKVKYAPSTVFRKRYLLVVLALVLMAYALVKNHSAMDKIEDACYVTNSKIALKDLLPVKWDDLYILYGANNSDSFYRDYQLTGKNNTTNKNEISLYFVLKDKVIYIENNDNNSKIRFGLSLIDAPYIEFQDRQSITEKMKRNGVIAIYKYETVLIFPSFDPLFDPCAPIPTDQQK